MNAPRLTPRDGLIAVLIGAAFFALYFATQQERVFGRDGAMLCDWAVFPERAFPGYHNILHPPLSAAFCSLFDTADPLLPVRSFQNACAAAALVFTYLCCRALGSPRVASSAATCMLGATPATWFFATTVEVHALHLLITSICAFVVLFAPWSKPKIAVVLSCVALALTYLSHQSAIALGLGWLLLAQFGRSRRNAPFSLPVLLAIGIVFLAALLLGKMAGNAIRGVGFAIAAGETLASVNAWKESVPVQVLLYEVLEPLALLLPLSLLGWFKTRFWGWRTAAELALVLPTISFIVYWGVVERGGYMIAPALALTFATARQLGPPLKIDSRPIALVAFAIQALLGWRFVHEFDSAGFRVEDRVTQIRALLPNEAGWVLSCSNYSPSAKIHLSKVEDFDLLPSFVAIESVEDWFHNKLRAEQVFAIANATGPWLLDRSYRNTDEAQGLAAECLDFFEAEIERRFEVEKHPGEQWEFWLVRSK